MKCRLFLTSLITIACCILSIQIGHTAGDIQQWRARALQIAGDSSLTDSLKVVRISDLCYNYFYYYRSFDGRNLDEFLKLVEPLSKGDHPDDLLSYIYGTAVVISNSDDIKHKMIDKCRYHTERCSNPIIAAQGWERLGRKHIHESDALDYFFKGLKVLEEVADAPAVSGFYRNIAMYYSIQGDNKNETKYARESLDIALRLDNPREIMSSWESIAESYYFRNDYPSAIEAYNEARKVYTQRLKPEEKDEDLRFRDAVHYMVIGVNLGSMYFYTGELDTAVDLMKEALDAARRVNMVETEAYSLKELGRIYIDQKQYKKAEEHLLETEQLLATDYVNTSESEYIAYEVELALANLYDITGEYRKSAAYYKSGIEKYHALHDEELLATNQQEAARYESMQQEEDIERRETIVRYHEWLRYLYAGILIVLLAALFFMSKMYHARIKMERQKEKEFRDRAKMLEMETRKTELDSELKQKEADELKEKLTLGNSLREQRNRTLEEVAAFFSGHPELNDYRQQVKNIVLQQTRIENNVDEFKQGMNGVPLDFYVRLQKIAANNLSSLDLKYCRLLYLDTPTKDIAGLLSVELKTVRMQKYRLKQKLNLDKDDDLNVFIRQITTEDKNETV